MRNNEEKSVETKKRSGKKILILVTIVIAMIALVALFYFAKGSGDALSSVKSEAPHEYMAQSNLDIEASVTALEGEFSADEEGLVQTNTTIEGQNFTYKLDPTIKVNGDIAEIQFENHSSNTYEVVVALIDGDTDKVVYQSGVIAPGYRIEEVKLDEEITNSTSGSITVSIYDPETNELVGAVANEVKITVE